MQKASSNTRKENLEDIKDTAQQSGGIAKQILNVLPIGVCITDKDGYFTYTNPHYRHIYGYEEEELTGKHFSMIVPDKKKEAMNNRHDEFMEKKYESYGEWAVKRKGGGHFKVLANAAYLKDEESGEPLKMTFMVDAESYDLSADSLSATVEMLNRKLAAQELAFHISNHDMHNNVGNITQLAELLRSTELNKDQNKYVDLIHKLSVRTLDMLKMSSDYLKMEKGEYNLQCSTFDLLKCLSVSIRAFGKESENRDLSFLTILDGEKIDLEKHQLFIQADEVYIVHMFDNLINNAVDATPDRAEIRLKVNTQDKLKISIHNRGAVPESVRDHFFDKFVTHGKEDGTGLGTHIARLIAQLHHGSIFFETSEEEGTTVFVELPSETMVEPTKS